MNDLFININDDLNKIPWGNTTGSKWSVSEFDHMDGNKPYKDIRFYQYNKDNEVIGVITVYVYSTGNIQIGTSNGLAVYLNEFTSDYFNAVKIITNDWYYQLKDYAKDFHNNAN